LFFPLRKGGKNQAKNEENGKKGGERARKKVGMNDPTAGQLDTYAIYFVLLSELLKMFQTPHLTSIRLPLPLSLHFIDASTDSGCGPTSPKRAPSTSSGPEQLHRQRNEREPRHQSR
jgi:hypothetical protein